MGKPEQFIYPKDMDDLREILVALTHKGLPFVANYNAGEIKIRMLDHTQETEK